MITGERVIAPHGGFNPTFQRHIAAYRLCAQLLPEGSVLDLGCGIGHSYRELEPRISVGVDIEPSVLAGQERETRVADMRALPFERASFDSVISIQSIEHVPDPEKAMAEVARVLRAGGRAVFVTPNRLTFGRANEIIDPYHYVEFDASALRGLSERFFADVEVIGLHGSPRYRELVEAEHHALDRLLALDPLRLRRTLPRRARQHLYDRLLLRERATPLPGAVDIGPHDFTLASDGLATALDLVAVCDTV
jgi:SAM-dependent methyltransferase